MEDPDTVLLEMAAAPTPQPPATSAAPAPAAAAAAPSAAVMVGQPIETIGAPRQQQQPIPPPRGGQAAASAGSAGRGRPARISRQPIVFDLRDTIQQRNVLASKITRA